MPQTTSKKDYILALDQGTTSSRALIFDANLSVIGRGQFEFTQHFPQDGWVEHDPEDIWQTTCDAVKAAIAEAGIGAEQLRCLGITNQRETTVLWHRDTGKPVYNAIVWQDRRTADYCQSLKEQGLEAEVQQRTGLLLDPYFSGTKLHWLLEHVPQARSQAEKGELCFGTIDSFLLWRLTGGKVHATDASNASRTLLMNLDTREWDPTLLDRFSIPKQVLPKIHDNAADFGHTESALFGAAIPITAMIGDQQGALMGQGCVESGQGKSTYGTGCFILMNCGEKPIFSEHKLLSTLAWQLKGQPTYALEGSIFMAGAIVQWLRDKLGIIQQAAETETLAREVPWQQSEMLIPAFTGLGAPYWQPNARAALLGMTRDTGKSQIAAAALRSVAYQTEDLLRAMREDGLEPDQLRVDGGMTENAWFLQALADLTGYPVVRAATSEITVRGAAFLAGLQVGIFDSVDRIQELAGSAGTFTSTISNTERKQLYNRWLAAVDKVR